MAKQLEKKPLHPGEILRDQFMAEFGLSANRVARDLRVPATRIAQIIHERRSVSPDTALRLARYFGTTPEFWINLQAAYELDAARRGSNDIQRDVRPLRAA
jgi:addiction module HigA family antidote